MSILVDRNTSKADRDIENLTEKRAKIGNALEALRLAYSRGLPVVELDGRQLIDLLSVETPNAQTRRQLREEEFAIRYLEGMGAPPHLFHRSEVVDALILTPELKAVFQAIKELCFIIDKTHFLRWEKFWNSDAKKFAPIPVTDAEKVEIRKRAEKRLPDQETANFYNRLTTELATMEKSRKMSGKSAMLMRDIKEAYPWMVDFVKAQEIENPGTIYAKHTWVANDEKFPFIKYEYTAPDEAAHVEYKLKQAA